MPSRLTVHTALLIVWCRRLPHTTGERDVVTTFFLLPPLRTPRGVQTFHWAWVLPHRCCLPHCRRVAAAAVRFLHHAALPPKQRRVLALTLDYNHDVICTCMALQEGGPPPSSAWYLEEYLLSRAAGGDLLIMYCNAVSHYHAPVCGAGGGISWVVVCSV